MEGTKHKPGPMAIHQITNAEPLTKIRCICLCANHATHLKFNSDIALVIIVDPWRSLRGVSRQVVEGAAAVVQYVDGHLGNLRESGPSMRTQYICAHFIAGGCVNPFSDHVRHLDLHGLAAGPHELSNLDGVTVYEVVRLPEVLDGHRRPARTGVDPHSNTHPECEDVGCKEM